jgi:hypothetical protein
MSRHEYDQGYRVDQVRFPSHFAFRLMQVSKKSIQDFFFSVSQVFMDTCICFVIIKFTHAD